MLPLKLFSKSLGLVFVFTTIYKQHNHRLIHHKVSWVLRFDGAIKEGDWRNIIKHDRVLNSFTKAKVEKVEHDAKVAQSSFKAYLSGLASEMAVGLYQKNKSIKKVIFSNSSNIYLPLGFLELDKYIISLYHKIINNLV